MELTPLQRNVLDKYETLSKSLHNLDTTIKELKENSSSESPEQVLRQLREIEVKIALIGTLFKGSVYSLVLQRQAKQNTKKV
ncbi:LANO_0F02014g1_1 [Lachancea nothofagi CBS 11611]|uniref:DASH complex subunit DAD3 n=1 Tax=Lachancea nothofagi CBS 11611 TaxID=1266666 RepID=A0A1G4K6L6_9SACH|nr:LANO_0F02014g1_1 [Lachancea nothofagi CBS 11611]